MEKVEKSLKLYTVKELAEQLSVSEQIIRRYIVQRKIRASKIGKSYIITEEALKEFLQQTEVK